MSQLTFLILRSAVRLVTRNEATKLGSYVPEIIRHCSGTNHRQVSYLVRLKICAPAARNLF